MINRFEAIGIFVSIALMSMALFLLNLDTATKKLSGEDAISAASVVLSDEDIADDLDAAVDASGNINRLIIDDVIVGSGEEVVTGDTVSVHYIGTLQNGQSFDNSYPKDTPFEFVVGEGKVIAGWEQGIVGMKQGGQRILVIPSNMAYGANQVGPIPANSTLVFAIELLAIK